MNDLWVMCPDLQEDICDEGSLSSIVKSTEQLFLKYKRQNSYSGEEQSRVVDTEW